MKVIYLGTAASDYDLENTFSSSNSQSTVYVQQKWDYIFYKSMEMIDSTKSYCISYPPIQTFPVGKTWFSRRKKISGLVNGVYINTINLPIIKQLCSIISVIIELLQIGNDETIHIITHTLYLQSLIAANVYKFFYPDTKIVSLVPDLPDYSSDVLVASSRIDRILYQLYKKLSIRLKGNVDGYVCFSELQMEKLNKEKPYIVMEGFSLKNDQLSSLTNCSHKERIFFYSGNLNKDSGVYQFAKAFSDASLEDYEFWICGEGEQKSKIEALHCSNIKLLGVLPKTKVLELQNIAHVLVNPRPIDMDFSKYSFPSKLLEYMSSGTPVLTTHLKCIPKEYDEYLYYIEDDSISGMRNSIVNLKIDKNIGLQAKAFVLTNKNPEAQVERVINYVKTL